MPEASTGTGVDRSRMELATKREMHGEEERGKNEQNDHLRNPFQDQMDIRCGRESLTYSWQSLLCRM
jgi:hypothetical protein